MKEGIYPKSYSGLRNQFAITKNQKPDLQNEILLTDENILSELRFRFQNDNYTEENASQYWTKYIYTPTFSNSPLSYVTIEQKRNANITITYTAKMSVNSPASPTMRSYGGSVTYTASVSNQRNYANPGELDNM
ncbi:MAG: hypothetical protein IJR57_02335 [Ruminococcus sp.]|nr:hypothetical protein [Ruminococcus sp.]